MPQNSRIVLRPVLSPPRRLVGGFTFARLGEQRFQLTASYASQSRGQRWFEADLPQRGVSLKIVSLARVGFRITRPNSRKLLSRVSEGDVSNNALPFLRPQFMQVSLVLVIVSRIFFKDDLGCEIYVDSAHQIAPYQALTDAGADLRLTPFGMRAMMSLRLEKSFGSRLREYRPYFTPMEMGLERFVRYVKADFISRDAAIADRDSPPDPRLHALIVDAPDADLSADDPIFHDGNVVGFVTSGDYAKFSRKSSALGMVPREIADDGAHFETEILVERCAATRTTTPILDPQGLRMRT